MSDKPDMLQVLLISPCFLLCRSSSCFFFTVLPFLQSIKRHLSTHYRQGLLSFTPPTPPAPDQPLEGMSRLFRCARSSIAALWFHSCRPPLSEEDSSITGAAVSKERRR